MCKEEGVFLCLNCQRSFKTLEVQKCIVCELPSLLGFTHPKCASPYSPNALLSVFNYREEGISRSIIFGKYYFIASLYEILGKRTAEFLKQEYPPQMFANFTFVPVPLSARRKRWRGYNQAEILAGVLSTELNLPLENLLTRNKNTRVQKDLKKIDRKANVLNSFALKAGVSVRGKNYIIVDDVVTTGATLIEACKVLMRNGAGKVWCVTVARD